MLTVGTPQLISIAVTRSIRPFLLEPASSSPRPELTPTTALLTSRLHVVSASSNLAVATISVGGNAAGTGLGSTTISATSGQIIGSTISTVFVPSPGADRRDRFLLPNPSISLGNSVQLTATAIYSDSSTQNVTNSAIWTSSNTTVAAVSNTGLAGSVAQGSSTINASYGGLIGSTGLTVSVPELMALFEERFNGGSHSLHSGRHNSLPAAVVGLAAPPRLPSYPHPLFQGGITLR